MSDRILEAATAALTALAEHGIHSDTQEVLVHGSKQQGVPPGALSKVVRAALVTLQGWQPIETAPKDGSSIWLWNGREMIVGWWETSRPFPNSDHFNDWCSGHETAGIYEAGFTRVYGPTHWMPLPEAPK